MPIRKTLWFALQLPIVGGAAWMWAADPRPDKPALGIVLVMGFGVAWFATALVSFFVDLSSAHQRPPLQAARVNPVVAKPLKDRRLRDVLFQSLSRL